MFFQPTHRDPRRDQIGVAVGSVEEIGVHVVANEDEAAAWADKGVRQEGVGMCLELCVLTVVRLDIGLESALTHLNSTICHVQPKGGAAVGRPQTNRWLLQGNIQWSTGSRNNTDTPHREAWA